MIYFWLNQIPTLFYIMQVFFISMMIELKQFLCFGLSKFYYWRLLFKNACLRGNQSWLELFRKKLINSIETFHISYSSIKLIIIKTRSYWIDWAISLLSNFITSFQFFDVVVDIDVVDIAVVVIVVAILQFCISNNISSQKVKCKPNRKQWRHGLQNLTFF